MAFVIRAYLILMSKEKIIFFDYREQLRGGRTNTSHI